MLKTKFTRTTAANGRAMAYSKGAIGRGAADGSIILKSELGKGEKGERGVPERTQSGPLGGSGATVQGQKSQGGMEHFRPSLYHRQSRH